MNDIKIFSAGIRSVLTTILLVSIIATNVCVAGHGSSARGGGNRDKKDTKTDLTIESITYPTSLLAKIELTVNTNSNSKTNSKHLDDIEISAEWLSNGVLYQYVTHQNKRRKHGQKRGKRRSIYTLYISVLTELTSYNVSLYINGNWDQDIIITTLALPNGLSECIDEIIPETIDLSYDPVLYALTCDKSSQNYLFAIHSHTGNIVAYVSFNTTTSRRVRKEPFIDETKFEFVIQYDQGLYRISVENEIINNLNQFIIANNDSDIVSDDARSNADGCAALHHWVDCLESDTNICYTLGFDWWFDDETNQCYYDDVIYKSNFKDNTIEEFLFFDKNTLPVDDNNPNNQARLPPFFYQYCSDRYVEVYKKLESLNRSVSDCVTRTQFNSIAISDVFGTESTLVINSRIYYYGSQFVVARETGGIIWFIAPHGGDISSFKFTANDTLYSGPHSSQIVRNLDTVSYKYDLILMDNQSEDFPVGNGISRALALELDVSSLTVSKKYDLSFVTPQGFNITREYCYAPVRSSHKITSRGTFSAVLACFNQPIPASSQRGPGVSIVVEFVFNENGDGDVTIINKILVDYDQSDSIGHAAASLNVLQSWAGEMLV